jgi:hypothetical protein
LSQHREDIDSCLLRRQWSINTDILEAMSLMVGLPRLFVMTRGFPSHLIITITEPLIGRTVSSTFQASRILPALPFSLFENIKHQFCEYLWTWQT